MIVGWISSMVLILWYPSIFSVFNPFLAPISLAIQKRKISSALCASYSIGILKDIVLSSPCLGLLGLSSLIATALTYRLSSLFSFEGWQAGFVVTLLAIFEFSFDILFCYAGVHGDAIAFSSMWSWKGFFLFVVFGCIWSFVVYFVSLIIHWCKIRNLRRSSS